MVSIVKLQFEHWKNGTKYYSHSNGISSEQKSRIERLCFSGDSLHINGEELVGLLEPTFK
ncbi:hypothetical protein CGT92_03905 [Vibrio metoecus]|uniref:Uncharacterized protein n=1 Tax=Vibrio metoecus TaxID=1481663 RepID=A0A271VPP0_VIBMT|nr:hypothetical protein CGU03_13540 [Vibrio metoecus]PAR23445.1 hypothetical protein CGU02_14400 [Vibrio metoecus]PAR27050.1 hypothetical protein CGU00_15900 [Vibrio metoecus]PAR31902.1 hypothetical protein CGT99_06985 [Vibrio metoecus]PAR37618.1 hypothetical protein CGT97_00170 [Vibrio metoecus]